MKSAGITPKSLPYLNKITNLEYLDIWRTQITLKDIDQLDQLKNLKEFCVSSLGYEYNNRSQMDRELISQNVINLQVILLTVRFIQTILFTLKSFLRNRVTFSGSANKDLIVLEDSYTVIKTLLL